MTTYHQSREDETFARQKDVLAKLGRQAPCVFDIGANVGQSISNYRQLFPDCTIRAFEPNPSVFKDLRAEWGTSDGIVLEQVGLADRDGEFPFYATRIPEVGSLLKPADRLIRLSTEHKYDYDIIPVSCCTLDGYCRRNGVGSIDIVKIDVQGNELAVLKGSAELLANNAIALVYLEIILAESYEQQSGMTRILDLMARHGYALWDIMPFLYTTPGRVWTANAIFLSGAAAATLENAVMGAVPLRTDAHP